MVGDHLICHADEEKRKMIKIIIGLLAFVFVLSIYNKVQEKREAKKIMDEVNKKLDYHKRPSPATFNDSRRGHR